MSTRQSRSFLVATMILCAAATHVTAGEWAGKQTTRNGVVHIMNPATPSDPGIVIDPEETFRLGGEDDEDVIFGVISAVAEDADGNVYLLDQQLSEIQVFSADGEFLRTIGREGEGPGEFRRASQMMMTPSSEVGVMQMMPGKIILLSQNGEPAGSVAIPEDPDGGRVFITRGAYGGGDLFLQIRQFARKDNGFEITGSLVKVANDGTIANTYWNRSSSRDFANMVFDEKENSEPVWTVGGDGTVYMNNTWDAYEVSVFDANGKLRHVIDREYESRQRSSEEMERNKPRIRFRRGGRSSQPESVAAKTDRDVQRIVVRPDGDVWVLSSKGGFDTAANEMTVFDVYDTAGHFTHQIKFNGEFDFNEDQMHFLGDRLVIVTNFSSASDAMFGGDDEDSEVEEDLEPLEVVCYNIGQIVKAKN